MTPENIKAYREALGGRRFLLVVGAGIVTSVLLYLGKLDIGSYETLQLATVGAFITASTTERIKGMPDQKAVLDPKAN